jgi:hypothetical protein
MAMTNMSGMVLVLVLAAGLAGCGGDGAPTAPSTGSRPIEQPIPQPAGSTIYLAGTVSDAAWRPLAGATVEVVSGPQAGRSVITDNGGTYQLAGAFDETSRFRATKEGHVAATWPLPPRCAPCNPNWWIHFYLEAVAPHANIAGEYTLTFIADSVCRDLPDEARTRTYRATVTPASSADQAANSRFTVTVTGATFVPNYNTFTIGVAGDFLATDIGDWGHGAPGLVEQVDANTYVTLGGAIATYVTDPSTISAAFHGAVDRCQLTSEWGSRYSCAGQAVAQAHCLAQNHRLTLKRR